MQISRHCFANFDADFRTNVAQHSCECCDNFHVSRTSHKGFKRLKILCEFFCQNISQDCRTSVVRCLWVCRKPVTANCDKFTMRNFCDTCTNVAPVSYDGRASLEKTYEHLATIQRENKTKRHSYDCRATL